MSHPSSRCSGNFFAEESNTKQQQVAMGSTPDGSGNQGHAESRYHKFRKHLKKTTGSKTPNADLILALCSKPNEPGKGETCGTIGDPQLQKRWDSLPLWKKRVLRRQANLHEPKVSSDETNQANGKLLIQSWVKKNRKARKKEQVRMMTETLKPEGIQRQGSLSSLSSMVSNESTTGATLLSEKVEDALMGMAAKYNNNIVEAMVSDGRCREKNSAVTVLEKMEEIDNNMASIEHDLGVMEHAQLNAAGGHADAISQYKSKMFGARDLGKELIYDFDDEKKQKKRLRYRSRSNVDCSSSHDGDDDFSSASDGDDSSISGDESSLDGDGSDSDDSDDDYSSDSDSDSSGDESVSVYGGSIRSATGYSTRSGDGSLSSFNYACGASRSGDSASNCSLGSMMFNGSVNAISRGKINKGGTGCDSENVQINLNGIVYIMNATEKLDDDDDELDLGTSNDYSSTGDDDSYLDGYLEEFAENFYVPDE